jgi:hypothetical protein
VLLYPGPAGRAASQVFDDVRGGFAVYAGLQLPVLNRPGVYTLQCHRHILLLHQTLV